MAEQELKIDPSHSGAHFSVRHMVVSKVRGRFTRFEGTVRFDEAKPEAAKVSVKLDASSIDTGDEKRDGHLKSPDFFDVGKYSHLTFESGKVEVVKKGQYKVHGTLTMHGVAKEVVLETEFLGYGKDPWGNQRAGFTATASLDRRDFGLTWNQALETGSVLVGEKVNIELEIEAVAQAAAGTKAA